jgi:hypothetical protein
VTEIILDFEGAPPNQRGGLTLIPPGPYQLVVTASRADRSGRGNKEVVVDLEVSDGPYVGETFTDYFAPVPPEGDDSKVGLQRFHAFLLACRFRPPVRSKFIVESLKGRKCVANVYTTQMRATEQYPEPRDISRIRSYEIPDGTAAAVAAPAAPARVAAEAPRVAVGAEEDLPSLAGDYDDDNA